MHLRQCTVYLIQHWKPIHKEAQRFLHTGGDAVHDVGHVVGDELSVLDGDQGEVGCQIPAELAAALDEELDGHGDGQLHHRLAAVVLCGDGGGEGGGGDDGQGGVRGRLRVYKL